MSLLISNDNTLIHLQGVTGYNEWLHWVFEKSLTKQESECEDIWLERLLHTAMAIEEQIEFVEHHPDMNVSEKRSDILSLTNRLRDFIEVIGFVPTNKGIADPEYLKPLKINTKPSLLKTKTYPRTENKFRQFLRKRLTGPSKVTLPIIWNELRNSEGETIDNLIEILSVSGNSNISIVKWLDDETGVEGDSLTRESVGKAISEVKKDIKNKIK